MIGRRDCGREVRLAKLTKVSITAAKSIEFSANGARSRSSGLRHESPRHSAVIDVTPTMIARLKRLRHGFGCIPIALAAAVSLAPAGARAQSRSLVAPFNASYTLRSINPPSGLPAYPVGEDEVETLRFKPGDPGRLLLSARVGDTEPSKLYEVEVSRDSAGHIIGFAGAPKEYQRAQASDSPHRNRFTGAADFAPNGTLLYGSVDTWCQIPAGQTEPATCVDSIGDTQPAINQGNFFRFVPAGFAAAGHLKLWSAADSDTWYDLPYSIQVNGELQFSQAEARTAAARDDFSLRDDFAFVKGGLPLIPNDSIVVAADAKDQGTTGGLYVYELNAQADPILSSRRRMLEGFSNVLTVAQDPVSKDFLFTHSAGEAGQSSQIYIVSAAAIALPTIRITAPRDGESFGLHAPNHAATVDIDPKGGTINFVQYYLDNKPFFEPSTRAPYTSDFLPTTPPGPRTLYAVVQVSGIVATSAPVTFIVGNLAPTVRFLAAPGPVTVGECSILSLELAASDPDGDQDEVTRIDLYDGPNFLRSLPGKATRFEMPVVSISPGGGTLGLKAVATDRFGAFGSSAILTVNIEPLHPNTLGLLPWPDSSDPLLCFRGVPDALYVLEATTSIPAAGPAPWTPISTNRTSIDRGTFSVREALPAPPPLRLFRVRKLP